MRTQVRRHRPRLEELERRELLSLSPTDWTPIGPRPVITSAGALAGRLTAAVVDPSDTTGNTVYVAGNRDGGYGEGAGIWRTTNWLSDSPAWVPLVDALPSMDIANHCLALAPSNPSVLYAAASGPNGGILRTADGGAHWQFLSGNLFNNTEFFACAVSPLDENVVYVAVWQDPSLPGGVYRSVDGGQTFVNITPITFGPVSASDLVINPDAPNTLYVALEDNGGNFAGVYQVTDNGSPPSIKWDFLTNGIVSGPDVGDYIELAMAPSNSSVLYATVFYNQKITGNPILERFITTDGGTSWTQLDLPPGGTDDRYWHAVLGVDPSDPFTFYINGDEPLLYSAQYVSGSTVNYTLILQGEDVVQVTFDLQGNVVLLADRGVLMNPDPTTLNTGWQNKRQDLGNVTFYNVTLDPNNPAVAYGVAQDQLGALRYTGTDAWQYLNSGGEIGLILVDPSNSQTIYNLSPPQENPAGLGPVAVSFDGGANFQNASAGLLPGDFGKEKQYNQSAYNAFAINTANPSTLVLGTVRVYQTTNQGTLWSIISPDLSGGWYVTALAIAPTNGTIYAATGDGKVWVPPPNPNPTTPWIERDAGLPINTNGNSYIQSIAVDPNDPNRVFVTYTAFKDPFTGGSVWYTTNGGLSWNPITGNLPANYQYTSIAVDFRFANPNVYVGTSRGVYVTNQLNPNAQWTRVGNGLPHTLVNDVEIDPVHNILAAATYGRGVFELLIPGPQPAVPSKPVSVPPPELLVVGPVAGAGRVKVYDARTRALLFSLRPFGRRFRGGVRVAVGDVTGDGVADVVTGSGPGILALVKVFSGAGGGLLRTFKPFRRYKGGVYVATADVTGNGVADVIIGQGRGDRVVAWSVLDGRRLGGFTPFGGDHTGGVTVAGTP